MSEQTLPPEKNEMPEPTVAEQTIVQQSLSEKQKPEPGKNGSGMLSGFGMTQLVLVVLVVALAWLWFNGNRTINNMERQLADKISDMSANSKASQILVSQSQGQVRELAAKVTMMETRFREARNQRAALEALYKDLSGNRDEAALAEVEQMLLIARQQLQLTANVKAALIALESGEARLKRMDQGGFNGLRNRISKDMDKLRGLPSLNVSALNLQLDDIISGVNILPLNHQLRVKEEEAQQLNAMKADADWKTLLRELWSEFKLMVRIENTGSEAIPLLSPGQEFFLRENLKLRLLSARIALLSRDESSFKQELITAQRWLEKYFDRKSQQSIRIQAKLKKLAASSINIDLPDISDSLQAVRDYRQAHERNVGRTLSQKGAK